MISMINETAKATEKLGDDDTEAIERWNNEDGASKSPKGASPEVRDAFIVPIYPESGDDRSLAQPGHTRAIEIDLRPEMAPKRGVEFDWLCARMGAYEKVPRHEFDPADTIACNLDDAGRTAGVLLSLDVSQAAQGPQCVDHSALLSYDLWRFSCEMPDMPHLMRNEGSERIWIVNNLAPHYVSENQSNMRGVKGGWYVVEKDGNMLSGPFSSRLDCLKCIAPVRTGAHDVPGSVRT